MEKLFNSISIAAGIIGGVLSYTFGVFDVVMVTLLVLMGVDYATGIIKAIYNKELSSYIGWKGLLKKVMTLCVVALSNTIEHLLGGGVAIRDIVIMFYAANEGLSIIENAAAVITVIPEPLKEVLMQLREDRENDNN